MTTYFFVLAQAGAPSGPASWMSFVPMLLILVVFYFLLVAPMRKRQKELAQVVDKLQKGDKVVTNGGLHGEVAGVEGAGACANETMAQTIAMYRSLICRDYTEGAWVCVFLKPVLH